MVLLLSVRRSPVQLQPVPGGLEDLDRRERPDEPFGLVDHVGDVGGIGLSDFQDLKEGDIIETYEEREIPRG
ncbi:MAG: hypothetical protein AAGK32_12080 [Actinomycetota bacterium]